MSCRALFIKLDEARNLCDRGSILDNGIDGVMISDICSITSFCSSAPALVSSIRLEFCVTESTAVLILSLVSVSSWTPLAISEVA